MTTNNTPINKAWMWQEGETTRGATLSVSRQLIEWHDDMVGFGCARMPQEQPLADFVQHGAKRYASPPADVLEEINAVVAVVLDGNS